MTDTASYSLPVLDMQQAGLQFIPIMIWIKYVGHDQPFLLSMAFAILIMAVCVLFDKLVRIKAKWLLGG